MGKISVMSVSCIGSIISEHLSHFKLFVMDRDSELEREHKRTTEVMDTAVVLHSESIAFIGQEGWLKEGSRSSLNELRGTALAKLTVSKASIPPPGQVHCDAEREREYTRRIEAMGADVGSIAFIGQERWLKDEFASSLKEIQESDVAKPTMSKAAFSRPRLSQMTTVRHTHQSQHKEVTDAPCGGDSCGFGLMLHIHEDRIHRDDSIRTLNGLLS